MRRREFVTTTAAALAGNWLARHPLGFAAEGAVEKCRTYASPREAMASPRETEVFVTALRVGIDPAGRDYLATVDADPASPTYSKIIGRVMMPNVGDELHHFGWNACSSCHADPDKARRYLIVPGMRSGRIHVLDAAQPRALKLHKVIEPGEIVAKTNLSAPHTVHCLPTGQIMISMLGDGRGRSPGGFLLLDERFEIVGRWEGADSGLEFNYDFWYQPRHNVMVSSEWAAPNTFGGGFDLKDVEAGKYGHSLLFWDWTNKKLLEKIDLGPSGMIPLEVRFHHNPDSMHGFVGAALSSTMWHWQQKDGRWQVEKVIDVPAIETKGWPFPVPGLITDLLVSLDDRFLYFSNWLHGDLRQYDISDPSRPKLTGQLWLGGVLGKSGQFRGRNFLGGPQMLQLSLDGRRLYVTNSLYSSWDNQFYPAMKSHGSTMLQIDCDTQRGGMELNEKFFVDFADEPGGPARAHEMRFPGGDCTSDIWIRTPPQARLMEKPLVEFEKRQRIGLITLANPQKRNVLSRAALGQLIERLDEAETAADVQCVILRSTGTVFSAGHDLAEIVAASDAQRESLFALCSQAMQTVRALSLPVIAQVQGLATAAGCQLAATCDLVVAAEEAGFATPGIKIGLFCSTPAVALSRAVGQKRAMEMLLTADVVPAREAERIGLVNRVVPREQLDQATFELAEKIANASPYTLGLGKRGFYEQLGLTTERAYQLTEQIMVENARAPDAIEGMKAFLERRPPRWGQE